LFLVAVAFAIGCLTIPASADWDPGYPDDMAKVKMHWPQLPDPTGYDVHASGGLLLADDWQCTKTQWVQDIHFWGSWMDDIPCNFLDLVLRIYADIPATETTYSMPGELLWEYHVDLENPDIFAIQPWPAGLQGWYCPYHDVLLPDNHAGMYQYNVFLPMRYWFWQEFGTIYWLGITAVVDTIQGGEPCGIWGWKSATYETYPQFNDDAVYWHPDSLEWVEIYHPPGSQWYPQSLDLAFVITGPFPEETDIQLNSLDAKIVDGLVELHWSTANEIDNAGFNVYRASSKDGVQEKINTELIPARGDEVSGAAYTFIDKSAGGYYWLEGVGLNGVAGAKHGPVLASGRDVPAAFSLAQNHPNPFNPNTRIMYNLAADCHVTLDIYNVLGQKVSTLVDEYQKAGSKTVEWNGRDASGVNVASGIYFYKITAGSFVDIKKMVLLR
jgi:hypothetical protein